jgi:hypothetical protein
MVGWQLIFARKDVDRKNKLSCHSNTSSNPKSILVMAPRLTKHNDRYETERPISAFQNTRPQISSAAEELVQNVFVVRQASPNEGR